jgi:hypothetical protein
MSSLTNDQLTALTANPAHQIRSIAGWKRIFDETSDRDHALTQAAVDGAGSLELYGQGAYAVDGHTLMFEATGETKYLDRAIEYTMGAIDSALPSSEIPTSTYPGEYLGWPLLNHPDITSENEFPLFESKFFRHPARTLRIMQERGMTGVGGSYDTEFQTIRDFIEVHMYEKWASRGTNVWPDGHLYRNRTHMASHWAIICLNLSYVTESLPLKLEYETVFNTINDYLRLQMQPHNDVPGGYWWSEVWEQYDQDAETPSHQDWSHGNSVAQMIVECVSLGRGGWTVADVVAIAETLLVVGGDQLNGYSGFVDGSGTSSGFFSDGFLNLGRYDPRVQDRFKNHNVGRQVQIYGAGARNQFERERIASTTWDSGQTWDNGTFWRD